MFRNEFGNPNWLGKQHRVTKTATGKATDGAVTPEDDRLVILSGAVWPANDSTAQGIVINKTDVTNGAKPIALMIEGYVYGDRLPTEISAEALAAMGEIKVIQYNDTEEE